MTATLPPSERVHGGEPNETNVFRRWFVVGCVVAAVVALVTAYAYLDEPSEHAACTAFHDGPPGIDRIVWDNGITVTGATTWALLFTTGIENGDAATRVTMAEAVAADTAGYRQTVAHLNPAERAAFDHLRGVALTLDASGAPPLDPATVEAMATVRGIVTEHGCDPHLLL